MKFEILHKQLAKVFGDSGAQKLIDNIKLPDNEKINDAELSYAFVWDSEQMGHEFWSNINYRIIHADAIENKTNVKGCDQVNAFLSTFECYKQSNANRMAYEIKPTDSFEIYETVGVLHTKKGEIEFQLQKGELVCVGDFIEIIQWPNVAVHWNKDQFLAQTTTETVTNRGDATLETWGPGNLQTAGTVIKVGSRYFIEIKNGRVMTAYYINGATRYGRFIDEDKKRNKALAELTARKKKPQVLEVGFWSRTVETVQGGAA